MKKNKVVSAIITSKNEEDVIGRIIDSLKNQSYKNIEIILVDNNSSDNTIKIARQKKIIVYKYGPERSAQRNFGAKKAQGKYLLFLDADMELSKKVISQCIKKIEEVKITGGVIIPEKSIAKNFWEKIKAYERSFYNMEGDSTTDAARFFKKNIFWEVGGYDEEITGPEDWDLPESIKNLGYKIDRITAKIYHHERISSFYTLIRKKYYYGLKSHRYLEKHKISPISPKTVYFLRPIFYKNWRKLILNPFLSLALFTMLFCELLAGAAGFVIGKIQNE